MHEPLVYYFLYQAVMSEKVLQSYKICQILFPTTCVMSGCSLVDLVECMKSSPLVFYATMSDLMTLFYCR